MATPFAALNQSCLKMFGSPVTYQRAAGGAPFPILNICACLMLRRSMRASFFW